MTFLELINEIKNKFSYDDENDIYELIYFFSSIAKNKKSIFLNLNKDIDFNYKKIEKALIKIYKKNVPLEHITKVSKFMSLEFFVNKYVLIPRKETEYITNYLIEKYKNNNKLKILDLCCGSGAIGISLSKFIENSDVDMVDKYLFPYYITKKNAKNNMVNVNVYKSSIERFYRRNYKYDLIVSNPPYIGLHEDLPKKTLKEPKQALFSSENGFFHIKEIINKYYNLLNDKGSLVIEIGYEQSSTIESYLRNKNYKFNFIKDMFNINRFIHIEKR